MGHTVSLLLALSVACSAQAAGPSNATKGLSMEYGPILSCSVEAPLPEAERIADKANRPSAPAPPSPDALKRIVARKGVVIKLGARDEGYVCFDTDTLRMGAGWTDGFLDLSETNVGTYKGNRTGAGVIAGRMMFRCEEGPGWSVDGKFTDPRATKAGPLPRELGRFKGLYLQEHGVVLVYEVAGVELLERTDLVKAGPEPQQFLARTISVQTKGRTPLNCLVASFTEGALESSDDRLLILKDQLAEDASRIALILLNPNEAKWDIQPARIAVQLRDVEKGRHLQFAYWHGTTAEIPKLRRALEAFPQIDDPRSGVNSVRSRWPTRIEMRGVMGREKSAYVVDTVPIPEENPWRSWMRISAFDFFSDGRAAVATLNGDVWLVSGLDETLQHVSWKRFAAGFFEPLGLKIVNGTIYVHGRDQITRLHDLNGDDEADFYECFNSDRTVYPSYHAYAYDLQTDRSNNFYYVVGGAWLGHERPWHACLVKVTPDGQRSEIVATGFRAPNGMAVGPNDEVTVSDNQGNWMPASKISVVRPNGFYGFVADPRVEPDAVAPATFDQPLCWIPQAMDNSSAGQVWAPSTWGPFGGKLLHTSYGAAALFAVLDERMGSVAQGGVVRFPVKFDSGIMRARFSPRDGQLYVAGLRGWQTAGSKDGCFQRVRFTGAPAHLPIDLHVEKNAIAISFAEALQSESALDSQNYAVEQWNYRWSSAYGSPDFSVVRPGAQGRDTVEISGVELSHDRKTIRLRVPELKPVMQMLIKLNIAAADGSAIRTEIANTIHRVPQE